MSHLAIVPARTILFSRLTISWPSSSNSRKPGRRAALAQRRHDLLRLDERHVRVVRPVHDQQRRGDPVDAVDRGQLAQQLGVGRRVAVLRGGRRRDPRLGLGVERGEVGDPAHVDADGEQLRETGQRGQRQVAAVRAARHADAGRGRPAPSPRGTSTAARTSVIATNRPAQVVGGDEAAPVAARAAHVRREHRHPRGAQRLEQRLVDRPLLGLRAAVQPQQRGHRPECPARPEQPPGQRRARPRPGTCAASVPRDRPSRRLGRPAAAWARRGGRARGATAAAARSGPRCRSARRRRSG